MKNINLKLLYSNILKGILVANLFSVPLIIMNFFTQDNISVYLFLKVYFIITFYISIIIIPIVVLFYQYHILEYQINEDKNVITIRYLRFIFYKKIEFEMDKVTMEINEVKNSYLLKITDGLFSITQWENIDWDEVKFRDFYRKIKKYDIFIKQNCW